MRQPKLGGINSLYSVILAIVLICPLVSLAQNENVEFQDSTADGLQDGPMQTASIVIRKILRLKTVDGKSLALDKESWEQPKSNRDELIAIRQKMFLDRGMKPADAKRVAERMIQTQAPSRLDASFARLRVLGMSSLGKSKRGSTETITCAGAELSCVAVIEGENFEFRVKESGGRQLTFDISEKLIRMVFTDADLIVILTQAKNGKTTGVITGEQILTGSSKNFAQFVSEHRDLAARLTQIFTHAGVDFPPTPHDDIVEQRVLARVRSIYSNTSSELDALIQELDAGDYTTREAASKKIISDFERFEEWIANRVADDSLAPEAKRRLDKIVKEASKQAKTDTRVDLCIDSNKLLKSPTYLIGLLDGLDSLDQRVVTKLLGDVTQERFGDDVVAWREWAKEKKPIDN